MLKRLKVLVRLGIPLGVLDIMIRARAWQVEAFHRARLNGLRGSVPAAVSAIRDLSRAQCSDVTMLQHEFIPSLGLNDEGVHEQPAELSPFFGSGLHIWQYPCQLAPYLAWLSENATSVTSYMEIGCRWGGMFILTSEWLRRIGADLKCVCAVDPIKPTPLIEEYFSMLREEASSGSLQIEPLYVRALSTSNEVCQVAARLRPDLVFIDGDHTLRGALADHMLVRDHAQIIVYHDVYSAACPETTQLWEALKKLESYEFEPTEFFGQYPSVRNRSLGIGALKRIRRGFTT